MTEVSNLEQQLEDYKILAEAGECAARLSKNSDFKKLIMQGFMINEAARYVQQSCDPALDAGSRADALAMAQASGHLKRFLQVTIRMGNMAKNDIPEIEAVIVESRSEDNN